MAYDRYSRLCQRLSIPGFLLNYLYEMELDVAIAHLTKDHLLQKIIQNSSLKPADPTGDVYFDLLKSISSQQLSLQVARAIFSRFCALYPDHYPTPSLLANIHTEKLRSAGLSNQKAGYMKNVAAFTLEHQLDYFDWAKYPDTEIIDLLTKIKGVGRWTAEMILIFTLDRPDVFPVDDLGIQQSMAKLYSLPETGKALRLRMGEIAEPWRPYRTIACRYLWNWKDRD